MSGVEPLQYFTTGELHGFTAGAGAPGASCCSMCLVPKGILFSAGMQLGQCFELYSKVLFLWLTSVLSLDANSFFGTKNNLMVTVLYLIYFELLERVKRMYDSGLLVKVVGQTGCKAQGETFRKETGAKFWHKGGRPSILQIICLVLPACCFLSGRVNLLMSTLGS